MERQWISLKDAAAELGVVSGTLDYYVKRLSISTEKFPLDRRKYIARADLERIKEAKQAAQARQSAGSKGGADS